MKKRFICALLVCVLLLSIVPAGSVQVRAASNMTVSDDGMAMIKAFEGYVSQAYWDNKQWSIGYGTACSEEMAQYYYWGGPNHLPLEQGEAMLREAIASKARYVNQFIDTYGLTVTQNQFDALVSLSYNVGPNWTTSTGSILHNAIKNGATGSELAYAFVLYSKSGATTSTGHIVRRLLEVNMYLYGIYDTSRAFPENLGYVILDGNGGNAQYNPHGFDRGDPSDIFATFTAIPQGVDEYGNTFNYTFAGWYTQRVGGTEVRELIGTTLNGSVLYAQWKNPKGEIVPIPFGTPVTQTVIVTGTSVNFREGPGTYYNALGKAYQGAQLTITRTFTGKDGYLWGETSSGWVRLDYTNYGSITTPDSGNGSEPEETVINTWGTVKGENVNIRVGPGANYEKTGAQKNTGERILIVATAADAEGQDRLWGKMEDGNWICMDYVTLDAPEEEEPEAPAPTVTGINMISGPDKTEYLQKIETLDLTGAKILVTYSDGSTETVDVTMGLITGFDNTNPGTSTIIVTYEGQTTAFDVSIIKPTVTFLGEDGSVLGSTQVAHGETITVPEEIAAQLVKPADKYGPYVFVGWDQELGTCTGNASFTARFELEFAYGDIDCDGDIDEDDALFLLRHVIFAEKYPIVCTPDFDNSGTVDEDDAIYLLRHIIFAEKYPLQ